MPGSTAEPCYVVKVAVIAATANTAPQVVTSVLYVAGMLLVAVAAGATGAYLARGRGIALRIVLAAALVLACVFYVTMLSDAVGALVEPLSDAAWVRRRGPDRSPRRRLAGHRLAAAPSRVSEQRC